MKAMIQRAYGAPEQVLELGEIETPVPADDEVLVRVHAASLHPDVWHVVYGLPYVVRLMGAGVRKPKQPVPGTDLAGTVEAVGKQATKFRVGDEVFGECVRGHQWHNGGAFAEYAAVPERALALKPANLSFEQAAAVPTSGLMAIQVLRGEGRLEAGQKVLIVGAAGGVGCLALQLAKAWGAEVTGVDSTAKLDVMRSLGADHVVDYSVEDFAHGSELYDLILDIPGSRSFSECKRVLKARGLYVFMGHQHYRTSEGRIVGQVPYALGLTAAALFVRQLPLPRPLGAGTAPLLMLKELLESGKLTPVVDRVFSLSELAPAIRYLESGQARGRIVIAV